jgi:hypothetical protein
MRETNERTIHETNTGVLGVKQNLACCENGSLCAHSNFFRVKSKIYCALTIHLIEKMHLLNMFSLKAIKKNSPVW